MEPPRRPVTGSPPYRFELGLTPAAPGRPWRAELRAFDSADVRRFDSPFELMRWLEQVDADPKPDGRLR